MLSDDRSAAYRTTDLGVTLSFRLLAPAFLTLFWGVAAVAAPPPPQPVVDKLIAAFVGKTSLEGTLTDIAKSANASCQIVPSSGGGAGSFELWKNGGLKVYDDRAPGTISVVGDANMLVSVKGKKVRCVKLTKGSQYSLSSIVGGNLVDSVSLKWVGIPSPKEKARLQKELTEKGAVMLGRAIRASTLKQLAKRWGANTGVLAQEEASFTQAMNTAQNWRQAQTKYETFLAAHRQALEYRAANLANNIVDPVQQARVQEEISAAYSFAYELVLRNLPPAMSPFWHSANVRDALARAGKSNKKLEAKDLLQAEIDITAGRAVTGSLTWPIGEWVLPVSKSIHAVYVPYGREEQRKLRLFDETVAIVAGIPRAEIGQLAMRKGTKLKALSPSAKAVADTLVLAIQSLGGSLNSLMLNKSFPPVTVSTKQYRVPSWGLESVSAFKSLLAFGRVVEGFSYEFLICPKAGCDKKNATDGGDPEKQPLGAAIYNGRPLHRWITTVTTVGFSIGALEPLSPPVSGYRYVPIAPEVGGARLHRLSEVRSWLNVLTVSQQVVVYPVPLAVQLFDLKPRSEIWDWSDVGLGIGPTIVRGERLDFAQFEARLFWDPWFIRGLPVSIGIAARFLEVPAAEPVGTVVSVQAGATAPSVYGYWAAVPMITFGVGIDVLALGDQSTDLIKAWTGGGE